MGELIKSYDVNVGGRKERQGHLLANNDPGVKGGYGVILMGSGLAYFIQGLI